MSENLIATIFNEFQEDIDQERQVRDAIRKITEELDQISREVSNALQVIHHDGARIEEACVKSKEMFAKAKESYCKLKTTVPAMDYYKFHDQWRYVTQRFCFLVGLTFWLEKGTLASTDDIAEVLGISSVEEKQGFHLDIEDFLGGLLQLCTELSRLAVNSVTQGDYGRPLQIYKFVVEINAGFRLLSLKNAPLRKRFDALKYDVKKIEEVIYDLGIRGLLPPTPSSQDQE